MKHLPYFSMLLVSSSLLATSFSLHAQTAIQWDKTFGGGKEDDLTSITALPDGGYLLAGTSNSDAGYEKSGDSRGYRDYWIIKINEAGDKLWDKTFGGNEDDFLAEVILTEDRGYLLAGRSFSEASGDKTEERKGQDDYWIIKIDENGNKQWDKTIGGPGSDQLVDVISTPDGGYLLAGSSSSDAGHEKSEDSRGESTLFTDIYTDYWIVKVDERGNKQWDKTFGGLYHDLLRGVVISPDGGYLLAGSSFSPASGDKTENRRGQNDYWIIKIDEDGNKQWDKTIGGESSENLSEVILTDDGSYLLAGSSMADFWIVKIDAQGNRLWDKAYGSVYEIDTGGGGSGSETLTSAILTADGGYLLAGYSDSGTTASGDKTEGRRGGRDYWIIKIDEDGNKQWDKTIGGTSHDRVGDAVSTPDGGYLVGGISNSTLFLDKTDHSRNASFDYWIVKIQEFITVKDFTLVNAETDQVVQSFNQDNVLYVADKTSPVTIRANPYPARVGSIKFVLEGPVEHKQTENYFPYALFGDDPGLDYHGEELVPGEYTLTATVYEKANLQGQVGETRILEFKVEARLEVERFTLINAESNQHISVLEDGDVLDLTDIGHEKFTVRAYPYPRGKVSSIKFVLEGPVEHEQTENYSPFVLFGDNPGLDYHGKELLPGEYTLTTTASTPYSTGIASTLSFTVIEEDQAASTVATDPLEVAVYPVPTSGEVNIMHNRQGDEATLMLLDFHGKVLQSHTLKEESLKVLDMSSYKKGFYYLKVIQQQEVQVKRIVVK